LRWLGLLALPLLLPLTVPGMATSVGALCLLLAGGLLLARPVALPSWLAQRRLPPALGERLQGLLARFNQRLLTRTGRAIAAQLAALPLSQWRHAGAGRAVDDGAGAGDLLRQYGARRRGGAGVGIAIARTARCCWPATSPPCWRGPIALLWWAGAEILAWGYRLLRGGWPA
jgi:hypothetical protein